MSDDDQNDSQDPGRLRQQIEEANARAAEARREADELKAKDVFRDAGLDPKNKQHAAFMRAYDGDLDATAVQAYVADLGVTSTPTPEAPAAPVVSAEEAGALEAMADASRGTGAPAPAPSERDRLLAELEALPWGAQQSVRNELLLKFSEAGGFKVARE